MTWTDDQEKSYIAAVSTAMKARREFIDAACCDLRSLNANGLARGLWGDGRAFHIDAAGN